MDIDYKIVRSTRKTLAIEIKPDKSVILRVPYLCSDEAALSFLSEKRHLVEKHLSSMPEPRKEMTSSELAALKEKARELIFPRVEYYSKIMGLFPSSVKITSAKRRFGSCSPKNGLCFSLYLAEYPPEAIDYVVVHELAHIKHKNHGSKFHKLIEKHLPNEKELIKLLKGRTEA